MKKFFMLGILLPLGCLCQIHFDKGYFIDNEGNRTECLIRNTGWSNNPTSFSYKIGENGKVEDRDLSNAAGFGIDDEVQFVRATVEMERSTERIGGMSRSPQYVLKPETHFLKVLYEGKNSLYIYEETGIAKFFFHDSRGKIVQLVHIRYAAENSGQIRDYNLYHSQLLENYSCPGETLESIGKVEYVASALLKYFQKVGNCKGEKVTVKEHAKNKFTIRPYIGYKSQKLDLDPDGSFQNAEISKGDFAYGLEAEYLLAVNKNKWSFFLALEYNKIEGTVDLPDGSSTIDKKVEMTYSAFQLPIGARYYMYLSDDVKLFVNPVATINLVSKDSKAVYESGPFGTVGFEKFTYGFGIGAGVGYKKFNLEARYYAPQSVNRYSEGGYHKFAFTLSYAVF